MSITTTTTVQAMSLEEFWDALDRHDWYRGFADRSRGGAGPDVCRLATASPVHRALFDAFCSYAHSPLVQRPPYRERELPKPTRPVLQADDGQWVATVGQIVLGRFDTEGEASERIAAIVAASLVDAREVRHG